MITHIQGRLVELNPAYVVIECNGVGYLLNISLNTYSKLGESESCKLYSHLVIKVFPHELRYHPIRWHRSQSLQRG